MRRSCICVPASSSAEEMTLRYPSVVNDRSWKNLGRLPKVKVPPVSCYDPAALIKDLLAGTDKGSMDEAAASIREKDNNVINNMTTKSPPRRRITNVDA